MNDLGKLIRGRMKELGQGPPELRRELRRALGVALSRQSIHAWMVGKARPSTRHLGALLDVLHVPNEEHRAWIEAAAAVVAQAQVSP